RQGLPEGDHPRVLGAVALVAPARVITVLLAPARVPPGRLQVAVGVGADPDVGPGGRDGQLADALLGGVVVDAPPVRVLVDELGDEPLPLPELLPGRAAADPGPGVVDVAKPSRTRGCDGIGGVIGNRRNFQRLRHILSLSGGSGATRPLTSMRCPIRRDAYLSG